VPSREVISVKVELPWVQRRLDCADTFQLQLLQCKQIVLEVILEIGELDRFQFLRWLLSLAGWALGLARWQLRLDRWDLDLPGWAFDLSWWQLLLEVELRLKRLKLKRLLLDTQVKTKLGTQYLSLCLSLCFKFCPAGCL